MVRSESESLVSQHEAEMVREPRQIPVLCDSDSTKRGCDIYPFKSPISELDPLQRLIGSHRTGSGLAFQLIIDCEVIYRSSPVSEKEILRERYATVKDHPEPSTVSSEPFKLSSCLFLSTGLQNSVTCISDSRYLRSETDILTVPRFKDILEVTCSISSALSHKYRTWNFCQHKSGRLHILDVGRSVSDRTTVVNDSELFDARTCNSCQCNPGRVHMQDIDRTQGLVSAVNACELFDLKAMNLYQCKPCRAHMLHIDRTESKMSAVSDSELHDTRTRNFYRCKPSRAHIDVAMSDLIALLFRLPILLALISKSITTVLNSTALPVLTSPELLFGETVHLFQEMSCKIFDDLNIESCKRVLLLLNV